MQPAVSLASARDKVPRAEASTVLNKSLDGITANVVPRLIFQTKLLASLFVGRKEEVPHSVIPRGSTTRRLTSRYAVARVCIVYCAPVLV